MIDIIKLLGAGTVVSPGRKWDREAVTWTVLTFSMELNGSCELSLPKKQRHPYSSAL